jgi:hypothetical protein
MGSYGMVAYQAYCNASDGKDFYGKPLRTWDELDDARRSYWEAAANAVADLFR